MARTILVVDDEIQIRKLIAEFLVTINIDVVEAENGEEALDVFNKGSVDLVISDIRMPLMNGLQLLKCIKSASPRTPVILMTGYQPTKAQELAMSTKADGYLIKPFSLIHLKNIINKFLQEM